MTRVFLVYTILASSLLFTASAEWFVETVSTSGGQTPAISLDSSGLPRIAYCRPAQGAKYSVYNGTYWSTYLIHYAYYGNCLYFDMVTDESDISHVSFSWLGVVYYAVQDPALDSWSVTSLSTPYVFWVSLGLSSQTYPGICFYSYDNLSLEYVHWNGSQWITELIDAATDTGDYNSMVREGVNKAHVAYSMTLPTPGLKYAYRDETEAWNTSFVDTSMTTEPRGMSIALDGNSYPNISYTTPEEVRYASWDGFSWNVETVWSLAMDDSVDSGAFQFDTSLALDQWDCPHIAHCSLDGDSLLYSWNDGSGWQTESVYPLNTYGGDPDLALDSQGRPHIAFCSSDLAGELMYAFNDDFSGIEHSTNVENAGRVTFNSVTNPFYGSLSLSFALPEAGHVELTVYDLQGREVARPLSEYRSVGNHLFSWNPDASLPCGGYMLAFNSNGNTLIRKVVYLK